MSQIKSVLFVLGALCGSGALSGQSGRLFLFPGSAGQSITVLDAATLANVGAIPAPANASLVVGLPDGSKYYIIANNPNQSITVVNGSNLSVVRQISLGANASGAVVTPDGRRLLVTAGTLRIFDTSNDQEIGNVPAGSGPTDIEVSEDSTRAYVMSAAGTVTVVNLTNNQQAAQYAIASPLSIALLPNGQRLVVLTQTGLQLINPINGNVASTIDLQITAGKVLVTPDSLRALVVNRGFTPTISSVVVDLVTREVRTIGTGSTQFDQMVIADNSSAFGVVSVTNAIAKVDLTTGTPTIQNYGAMTRQMEITPSGRYLYLISFQNRTVARVDVPSNAQQTPQTVSIPPVGGSLFALPSAANASSMILNGGDRQNVLAGQTTPFPLLVKVTTADGTPVFNIPVTFSTNATSTNATGVSFTPTQPSRTNSRGVATAYVTIPAASTARPVEDDVEVQAASEGGPVEQFGGGSEIITITASAAGTPGVTFTLAVNTTTGLVIVSGSNQLTTQNQPFPLPLVVRATGSDGSPLVGVAVTFNSLQGLTTPFSQQVFTDGDGVASAQVGGGSLPPFAFPSTVTQVLARIDSLPDVQGVTFFLTLSSAAPSGIEVVQGENQEGDAGAKLPIPLCVQIGGSGAIGVANNIGVYFEVLDGPAGPASATLNPPIGVTSGNGIACTEATLGPRAGPQEVIIRARVPTVPNFQPADGVRFRGIRIKGGPPARITITQGNNQEGRPGQTLSQALRVRVFDQGGNPIPLPHPDARYQLQFTIDPARAGAISNFFQQPDGEASVLVTIALNYVGEFKVIATAGDARAEFTFRSVAQPSAIVRVSGQDQSAPVGGTTAQPVVARVNDAQGQPVPGVEVTFSGPSGVTFVPSQGPSGNPLRISSGADGTASVRVQIAAGTAPGTVTVTATASVGNVTFSITVTGRTPSFTAAAIVNAASFVAGIVPGGLATLFGTGLSEITGLEFPGGATTHRGVQVRMGGQAMPLFLIRNESGQEQINFQARTDIPGPSTVTVEVSNNGSTFSISNVPVLRAQPGIFEYTPQGSTVKYAAALKPDGSVIGPNNRVPRGTAFSIFVTGMGPTLPLLPTGQAAPSSPLATTFFQPTVGVGGRGMRVLFSGLAPGFIGLGQINVLVSEDAQVGDAVTLDVIVEGVPSQTSRIAIQ